MNVETLFDLGFISECCLFFCPIVIYNGRNFNLSLVTFESKKKDLASAFEQKDVRYYWQFLLRVRDNISNKREGAEKVFSVLQWLPNDV